MENTVEMIQVSIAKLGTSIQTVDVAINSTVMTALRKAGYNLDEVQSIKRNGTVVTMDTTLAHEDTILVSIGKIKGGNEGDDTEGNVIKLAFSIEKENQITPNGMLAFLDTQSTFSIIQQVMNSRGVSMNSFKEIKNEEGDVVSLSLIHI